MKIKQSGKYAWHTWFAWFPVSLESDGESVWGEDVYRRYNPNLHKPHDWEHYPGVATGRYEYATELPGI